MKISFLFFGILLFTSVAVHGQQINPADLIGIWDQNGGSHPPTMIFVDNSGVRFSYKGHTGTSKKYDYLINNNNVPIIMTVYKKANHRKIRNEYLIQVLDKDTMKLQVLRKKSPRDHFDEDRPDKIFTLVRRK
jgi:hypothetical protein